MHNAKAMVICTCGKYLYTRRSVYSHSVKHDTSQGIKYVCILLFFYLCNVLISNYFLRRCDKCEKTFENRKAMEIHSYVHLPKDQYAYVCYHCTKRFPTVLSLNLHEKIHLPKELRNTFLCNLCDAK